MLILNWAPGDFDHSGNGLNWIRKAHLLLLHHQSNEENQMVTSLDQCFNKFWPQLIYIGRMTATISGWEADGDKY